MLGSLAPIVFKRGWGRLNVDLDVLERGELCWRLTLLGQGMPHEEAMVQRGDVAQVESAARTRKWQHFGVQLRSSGALLHDGRNTVELLGSGGPINL